MYLSKQMIVMRRDLKMRKGKIAASPDMHVLRLCLWLWKGKQA